MKRALWIVLLLALVVGGCGGGGAKGAPTMLSSLREDARESDDADLVGRWLLAEMLSPGGDARSAKKARKHLDELSDKSLYASLARGLDDAVHGRLATAPDHFLEAVRAARAADSDDAELIAWYAAHQAVALRHNAPDLWKRWRPFVEDAMREPMHLGWRARSELTEWWADEAYSAARRKVDEAAAKQSGCLANVRLAGPFGRGVAPDTYRHFPAEQPGPWPTRWKPNELTGETPHLLKSKQEGCFVHADESTPAGIYYGESFLELDTPREVIIAAQGAFALWVDDTQVLDRDPRKWGVWPEFGVQVWLPAGRHRILARLANPQTSIRVVSNDGAPFGAKSSVDAAPPYSIVPPRVTKNPNVLGRYIKRGNVVDPKSDLLRYLAASLAYIEGQGDVASVLSEPLLKDMSKATGPVLVASATFADKDPLFDRTQVKDLVRELHQRAVKKDPEAWQAALSLALWKAERAGPADAVTAVRGLVDEFPQVPGVLLALSRLYGELGWSAEYANTAKQLAVRFPEDVEALTLALSVYDAQGDRAKADDLVARIMKLDPDSEVRLSRALEREDYKTALTELKRLGERRPERKDIAERVFDVMVRAGNASESWKKLEAAIDKEPKSGPARLALADARYAGGQKDALRKALVDAVAHGAGTSGLEDALDLVDGMTQLEPYRLDALQIIKDYEKKGEHLPGTAARVLDYAAIWVHADGSSRMLEHEVVRIQSPEAISKLAEQVKPDGLVLHMRVIKKDGHVLEPELVPGKPSVTFPHLEVGDYIETEHIITKASESEGGRQYLSPHWFFREENVAYARSEFVVITPEDKQLVIETRGQVPPPKVQKLDGLVVHDWRVDESPAAPQEPGSAPITEFLPSVRLGWGITLEQRVQRLADTLEDITPVDPRIVRIAKKIVSPLPKKAEKKRAQRLYRWVLANVEDGPETDGRRVVVGKHGNRWRGFMALCRALGMNVEYAAAKNQLAPPPVGPLERASQFTEPLLRLDTDEGPVWLTLGSKYAPFGYVPVEIRGVPAYVLAGDKPKRVTTPVTGTEDSVIYEGTFKVARDGSARIDLVQRFYGKYAMAVRSAVAQLSEGQLRDLVESRLLGRSLRGARLMKYEVEARDDLDKPLVLHMIADMSNFAPPNGAELLVAPPFSPHVSQLATLPKRQTPLLIGETTHQEVRLRLELPAGASVAGADKATVKDGNKLIRVNDRMEGSTLILDRVIDIPAGRVQPGAEYKALLAFIRRSDELLEREIVFHR